MKNFVYIAVLVLAVSILGCTATVSKDTRLSDQALQSISNRNYLEAENYLHQALAENPDNPYALLNLGVVYQNTDRPTEAKVMYERVIKLNPQDIAGQSNIGGTAGKTLTALARENLNRLNQAAASPAEKTGRFLAYNNGTVWDTKTNLMWAARDNGVDVNWSEAKLYCENYQGGGHRDWRVPTQAELAGLYDARQSRRGACNRGFEIHVATELIDITCFAHWAYETRSNPAPFDFGNGLRYYDPQTYTDKLFRALPVRDVK